VGYWLERKPRPFRGVGSSQVVDNNNEWIEIFFNPLDGQYTKVKDVQWLISVEKEFRYYYEKNFLAYVQTNITSWDSWDKCIDVDIRQQAINAPRIEKKEVIIIQPKISGEPKVYKLDFVPKNVFKHPAEPMLIVYDDEQYTIFDLET